MAFPRVIAVFIILLLIGSFAIAGIGITSWLGPKLAHGTDVKHAAGKILSIQNGRDFTFLTKEGQHMSFECRTQCRGSLGHMQRHVNEKAPTDVYYIQGPGNTLQVIDVD
ncbi:MAG TPA: hypothetical protein VGN34_05985 [Ktedonobacteraceae bacterium]|jgi:hypothetical protein